MSLPPILIVELETEWDLLFAVSSAFGDGGHQAITARKLP